MPFPNYLQNDARDCGPACLQILCRHYGQYRDIEELRRLMDTDREGTTVLSFIQAAGRLHLRCTPYSLSYYKFRTEVPLPVTVLWKGRHFMVVYRITRRHVHVSDPASGRYRMTLKEFADGWLEEVPGGKVKRGVCITSEPTPEFEASHAARRGGLPPAASDALRWAGRYLRPFRSQALQVAAVMAVMAAFAALLPVITQAVVDTGIPGRDTGFIGLMLGAMVALALGRTVGDWFQGAVTVRFGAKMKVSMVSDYLERLMRLPMEFFERRLMGDIIQRSADFDRIETMATQALFSAFLSTASLALFGTILAVYDSTAFWIFAAGAVLYVGWVLFFWSIRRRMDIQYYSLLARNNSLWIEMLSRIADIKSFRYADAKRWQWEKNQTALYRTRVKLVDVDQWQNLGSGLINAVKDALLLYVCARGVMDGRMTIGMLAAVQFILGQLHAPLEGIVNFIVTLQLSSISYSRVSDIQSVPSEDDGAGESDAMLPRGCALGLEGVTYRYGPDAAALNPVTLAIPSGKTVAIVGESGCGKSTLLKVLCGLYRPTSGRMTVGDADLRAYSPDTWRERCGAVLQDSDLTRDTIYNNIVFGRKADDTKVVRAATIANIHGEILSMPRGYDTPIGENGRGVSEGQKQRILLARALYGGPDYIFLDEMTGALDARREEGVVRSLKESLPGRTIVVVSHRRQTVEAADLAIVLRKGSVVEAGEPAKLRLKGGEYARLFYPEDSNGQPNTNQNQNP